MEEHHCPQLTTGLLPVIALTPIKYLFDKTAYSAPMPVNAQFDWLLVQVKLLLLMLQEHSSHLLSITSDAGTECLLRVLLGVSTGLMHLRLSEEAQLQLVKTTALFLTLPG